MNPRNHSTTMPWSSARTRIACAILAGVALAGCVAGWDMPWVGWLALAPLFLCLWGATWKWAFDPGNDLRLLTSPAGRFGVTLCNESVYSGKSREWARMGAQILVNMGNDAWTPGTWALRQHLTVNVMRAAELGLWYVIANNSGISGIVDNHGVVRARSTPRTIECLVGEVRPVDRPSFYAAHGDIFAGTCVLAAIAGLSAKSLSSKQGHKS